MEPPAKGGWRSVAGVGTGGVSQRNEELEQTCDPSGPLALFNDTISKTDESRIPRRTSSLIKFRRSTNVASRLQLLTTRP